MGEVIEFRGVSNKGEDEGGSLSGDAFCMACDHEWVATAPSGTVWLECPSCHTHRATFRFHCDVPNGTLVRECDCGNQLFYLTLQGHLCPNCGIYQQYD